MTQRELKYESKCKPVLNEQQETKAHFSPFLMKAFNFSKERYLFSSAKSDVIFASFRRSILESVGWVRKKNSNFKAFILEEYVAHVQQIK